MKFEAELQQLQDFTFIKLTGSIDEDNELNSLTGRIRGQTAVIDLASVQEINNCGVRDWVNCLEALHAQNVAVVLVECSPAVVAKLNSVSNFIQYGWVKSFYIPFYCTACEREKAVLVDFEEVKGEPSIVIPTCRCDGCDGIMNFDDLEDSYFNFVKDIQKGDMPDMVRTILEQHSPSRTFERKTIAWSAHQKSSFEGIPSSVSSAVSGITSISAGTRLSASSLKRLRDKTGVRAKQKKWSEQVADVPHPKSKRWLYWAATLVGILIGGTVALYFWVG